MAGPRINAGAGVGSFRLPEKFQLGNTPENIAAVRAYADELDAVFWVFFVNNYECERPDCCDKYGYPDFTNKEIKITIDRKSHCTALRDYANSLGVTGVFCFTQIAAGWNRRMTCQNILTRRAVFVTITIVDTPVFVPPTPITPKPVDPCTVPCPPGWEHGPEPDCVCQLEACPDGQVRDAVSGQCVTLENPGVDLCAGKTCPTGQVCNPRTGECVDIPTPTPPGSGIIGLPGFNQLTTFECIKKIIAQAIKDARARIDLEDGDTFDVELKPIPAAARVTYRGLVDLDNLLATEADWSRHASREGGSFCLTAACLHVARATYATVPSINSLYLSMLIFLTDARATVGC